MRRAAPGMFVVAAPLGLLSRRIVAKLANLLLWLYQDHCLLSGKCRNFTIPGNDLKILLHRIIIYEPKNLKR